MQGQPAEEPKSVLLKQGEAAPFAGKLYNVTAAANITASYDVEIAKLKAEIDSLREQAVKLSQLEQEVCEVRVRAETNKYDVCVATMDSQKSVYEKAITRIGKDRGKKWYESPYLNFFFGVAACTGTAAAVGAVR